ncbi:MAG: DUF3311 domain-containing protein [Acidobacteriaceae bacterium]
MRSPRIAALGLGLIPFLAICFSVPLWDRIHPMIFGLPFNLFWLLSWTVLTPACMGVAYRLETSRDSTSSTNRDKERSR